MSDARAQRIADIVAGVLRQALRDARAAGVVVLDDGGAAARLARTWCERAAGADRVWPVAAGGPGPEGEEQRRMEARLAARRHRALLAHPACKTELLLGDASPPEPLLPLGDLYAREVVELAGECTLSPAVARIAELAGGITSLDAALYELLERRADEDAALARLAPPARAAVLARLAETRFARRRPGLIPKLGQRTLGIDLFA